MGLWTTDLLIMVALVATSELSFRFGRRARRGHDEVTQSQITTVQAATLGLLALILGFTLSMVESRFTHRRLLLRDEANAVGTTYLRTDFLPGPESARSKELLRSYILSRRAYYRASEAGAAVASAHSQAIARDLWAIAASVGNTHHDWGDILATYIESLNEMIDLEASRDLANIARLPRTINFLLVLLAAIAVGITGYAAGLTRLRHPLALYIVPVTIALACAVVADLDRTRAGFITTGDFAMQRLQRTLGIPEPGPGQPVASEK